MVRLQKVFGKKKGTLIFGTARAFIFAFTMISILQSSVQGFDKPENWFPPTLVTYEFAIGEPRGVIPGDFDGDGNIDLVLLTAIGGPKTFFDVPQTDSAINFYLLRRSEGWREPVHIAALPIPKRYLLSGTAIPGTDLDSDGNLDVAAILTFAFGSPAEFSFNNLETYLIILWGCQDTRGFTLDHMRLNVGLLPPSSLIGGDFNADDLVDLAFADPQRLAIQVLYNRGNRLWSDPYLVSVAMPDDECIAIPVGCVSGVFDKTKKGDQLAVLSVCMINQENFKQVLRFLLPHDEERWEHSPLFLIGQQLWAKFEDAGGILMASDFDGDGCSDLLFAEKMENAFLRKDDKYSLDLMKIYLFTCPQLNGFENSRHIGVMPFGSFLSAEYDSIFGWRIVALRSDRNAIDVLHVSKEGREFQVTPLSVRGYIMAAVLIPREDRREVVVVSSLDLRSGVTLVNVITRRAQ